jgi:hypothetical protein
VREDRFKDDNASLDSPGGRSPQDHPEIDLYMCFRPVLLSSRQLPGQRRNAGNDILGNFPRRMGDNKRPTKMDPAVTSTDWEAEQKREIIKL